MTQEEPPPRQVGIQGGDIHIERSKVNIAGRDQYNYVNSLPRDPNQKRLLQRVRKNWVEGVLEPSLQNNAPIPLEILEEPEMIREKASWDAVVAQQHQSPLDLFPGISPDQIYKQADGEILILGEPGSGKTTFLLQLARALLDRALQGEELYLPVIFNLSFWAQKQLPIEKWLVEELEDRYGVQKRIAQLWISSDQILPLLDGLDEVAPDLREECVQNMNAYHRQHGLVPIVVCCRKAEYQALEERLFLYRAVCIQPLTEKQVQDYVTSTNIVEESLYKYLSEDALFKDLLKTPFMVSILLQAFQGKSIKDLENLDEKVSLRQSDPLPGELDGKRKTLFDAYVDTMFEHRERSNRHRRQEVIRQLSWLAQQLSRNHLTQFSFRQIYLDWVPPDNDYRSFCHLIIRCIAFSVGFLASIWVPVISPSQWGLWLYPIGMAFLCSWMSTVPSKPGRVVSSLSQMIVTGCFLGFLFLILTLPFSLLAQGPSNFWSSILLASILVFASGFALSMLFDLVGHTSKRSSNNPERYKPTVGYIEHKVSLLFLRSVGLASPHAFEHATSCLLLHKAGREYMFIHPLLLDYFAALDHK